MRKGSPLIKVISGGQTGADIGGLRAARRAHVETGGWAPKGYMTERGSRPFLLGTIYGLKEHSSPKYPPRTIANIKDSQMTLIIASHPLDGGSALTRNICFKLSRPVFHIMTSELEDENTLWEVLSWINPRPHKVINVAGNRESKSPGIGKSSETFLAALFRSLR